MTNGQRGTDRFSASRPISGAAPIDQQKSVMRTQAELRRDAAARSHRASSCAAALRSYMLGAIDFPAGCVVSAYWPMGSEIDIRPSIDALHARGHAIGLPVTLRRGAPLVFRTWTPESALVSGGFGTHVPGPEFPELRPAVLLVPLLAFDRRGIRLGYGGGFYDRTLAQLRAASRVQAIGVAYAAQEVASVPHGEHDQALDWIVTEAEAIQVEPRGHTQAQGNPA